MPLAQGPTSFIDYEKGLVIFEYSHVFRSGGSLMLVFDHEKSQNHLKKLY
jgi:hypothetical protein